MSLAEIGAYRASESLVFGGQAYKSLDMDKNLNYHWHWAKNITLECYRFCPTNGVHLKEIDIDRSLTFNFVRYFEQKGFIKFKNEQGSTISITTEGIDEVDRLKSDTSAPSLDKNKYPGNDIFIVHGHDAEAKVSVARFIEKLGLNAIILHEMANIGRTIIEKFEDHSNVGYAVVLLTPDDLGTTKDKKDELKPRARQNVIFELGYFIGKLGRKRVCVLHKENVEILSDYKGIIYLKMDKEDAWTHKLAREMKEGGIKIDPTKLL